MFLDSQIKQKANLKHEEHEHKKQELKKVNQLAIDFQKEKIEKQNMEQKKRSIAQSSRINELQSYKKKKEEVQQMQKMHDELILKKQQDKDK